jgi:hypothetical protein
VFGAGCILIMVAHAMNLSFYQGMEHFANFTYIPASTWMAAYAFFFLRDKMITAEETPFNGLVDWFAIATLIDHAGAIPILSLLGWTNYINSEYSNHLFDLVTLLYMFWYLLILSGLLWTRTSLRSVFSSR